MRAESTGEPLGVKRTLQAARYDNAAAITSQGNPTATFNKMQDGDKQL